MGETTNEVNSGTTPDPTKEVGGYPSEFYFGETGAAATDQSNTTDNSGEGESPEEIEARIAQTRAEMGDTINALQAKLNPEVIKEQVTEQVKEQVHEHVQSAKHAVREATIGKAEQLFHSASETVAEAARPVVEAVGRATGSAVDAAHNAGSSVASTARGTGTTMQNTTSSLFDTLRQNPLATAVTAIGIGMLMTNRGSGKYGAVKHDDTTGYRGKYGGGYTGETPVSKAQSAVSGAVGGLHDSLGHAAEKAGDLAGHTREKASDLADQTREKASDIAGHTREAAHFLADQAQEKAHDVSENARYQSHLAQDRFQEKLQETPLAVGAVALAVGAAVGLLLPSTEPEKNLLGQTGGHIRDTAQHAAQDAVQKVQSVAGRVVEEATKAASSAATSAAQEQGFTSQS